MKKIINLISATLLLWGLAPLVVAQSAIISQRDIFSPVEAQNGMVVTAEPIATQIGVEVLKQGGNAIDAAVTIGFVMAVTYPHAGNIGGGGFMLIHSAKQVIAIDYRQTAPALAHRDMFLDKKGNVDSQLSRFSHLSAGVPGTVAGLALALEKYGTLSLAEALAPAIQLAEEGFVISPNFSRYIKQRAERFEPWAASRAVFLKPDGGFYEAGDLLVQKDLAKTLTAIANNGIKAFYEGEIAELIVKEMATHGGLISQKDLANYQPVIRQPVYGTYRNYQIASMSPPVRAVSIYSLLNILEKDDLASLGHNRRQRD